MEETIEKQTNQLECLSDELSSKENDLSLINKENYQLMLQINRLEEMFVETKISK